MVIREAPRGNLCKTNERYPIGETGSRTAPSRPQRSGVPVVADYPAQIERRAGDHLLARPQIARHPLPGLRVEADLIPPAPAQPQLRKLSLRRRSPTPVRRPHKATRCGVSYLSHECPLLRAAG